MVLSCDPVQTTRTSAPRRDATLGASAPVTGGWSDQLRFASTTALHDLTPPRHLALAMTHAGSSSIFPGILHTPRGGSLTPSSTPRRRKPTGSQEYDGDHGAAMWFISTSGR